MDPSLTRNQKLETRNSLHRETMILNMGPQHPSTHGVLRIVLELDGEIVVKATPDIGYLHRGVEKLAEYKTWHQCITLTDRLDYVAGISNGLPYVLALEKLLGVEAPPRAQAVRVLMSELQRIASHLFWLGTHAHDIGAMTPLFYALRERDEILFLFERVSGARLTPSYFRVGGLAQDLPDGFETACRDFVGEFPAHVDEYETLLTRNAIWRKRTQGVGAISSEEAISWGLSGPLLRASGVNWDLRRSMPYCGYERYDFIVPLGENGDVYDRYLVRVMEMRQSNEIVRQVLDSLPKGEINIQDPKVVYPPRKKVQNSIEAMIHHFHIASSGFPIPAGEVYASTESTKGELGFYLVSDGGNKPVRFRVRPPSFVNLSALRDMIEGRLISDVVAVIGSIDIVLAEVDR
jgi:NADH-quinone oxidoreductase subunit D